MASKFEGQASGFGQLEIGEDGKLKVDPNIIDELKSEAPKPTPTDLDQEAQDYDEYKKENELPKKFEDQLEVSGFGDIKGGKEKIKRKDKGPSTDSSKPKKTSKPKKARGFENNKGVIEYIPDSVSNIDNVPNSETNKESEPEIKPDTNNPAPEGIDYSKYNFEHEKNVRRPQRTPGTSGPNVAIPDDIVSGIDAAFNAGKKGKKTPSEPEVKNPEPAASIYTGEDLNEDIRRKEHEKQIVRQADLAEREKDRRERAEAKLVKARVRAQQVEAKLKAMEAANAAVNANSTPAESNVSNQPEQTPEPTQSPQSPQSEQPEPNQSTVEDTTATSSDVSPTETTVAPAAPTKPGTGSRRTTARRRVGSKLGNEKNEKAPTFGVHSTAPESNPVPQATTSPENTPDTTQAQAQNPTEASPATPATTQPESQEQLGTQNQPSQRAEAGPNIPQRAGGAPLPFNLDSVPTKIGKSIKGAFSWLASKTISPLLEGSKGYAAFQADRLKLYGSSIKTAFFGNRHLAKREGKKVSYNIAQNEVNAIEEKLKQIEDFKNSGTPVTPRQARKIEKEAQGLRKRLVKAEESRDYELRDLKYHEGRALVYENRKKQIAENFAHIIDVRHAPRLEKMRGLMEDKSTLKSEIDSWKDKLDSEAKELLDIKAAIRRDPTLNTKENRRKIKDIEEDHANAFRHYKNRESRMLKVDKKLVKINYKLKKWGIKSQAYKRFAKETFEVFKSTRKPAPEVKPFRNPNAGMERSINAPPSRSNEGSESDEDSANNTSSGANNQSAPEGTQQPQNQEIARGDFTLDDWIKGWNALYGSRFKLNIADAKGGDGQQISPNKVLNKAQFVEMITSVHKASKMPGKGKIGPADINQVQGNLIRLKDRSQAGAAANTGNQPQATA